MPREKTNRIPMTIVCVRGSELVPARIGYFRLAELEKVHKEQISCVGFHAVLPPGSDAGLRLFAVPADTAYPAVELTTETP